MAQLTQDKSRKFKLSPDVHSEQGVDAASIIYMNAFVGQNPSTYLARQLVAGDKFFGIAFVPAWNIVNQFTPNVLGSGGVLIGAAGGVTVELRTQGILIATPAMITGATGVGNPLSLIGTSVYMSDSDTLTLASTGNTKFGNIRNYLNGEFEVFFKAFTEA